MNESSMVAKTESVLDSLRNELSGNLETLSNTISRLDSKINFILSEDPENKPSAPQDSRGTTSPVESYIAGLCDETSRLNRRIVNIIERVTL
jgi:hypothetical protein